MQVLLTPELEDLIQRKVESGLYGDSSEVIRDALRLLAARDRLYDAKLARLREALATGEQSGFIDDFEMAQLMAELDEEARREGIAGG
jgi:antitoxin ParD1/3/4